ncbi:MAG: hydroxymethylbilane synthase, partial [Alphaproteobacteria bacterium]|nr:hydroxymethylbilane synthase [Alphaproteobacteria bacterium]
KLALAQSEEVKARLLRAYPDMDASQFEIVPMTTTGDRVQDKTLQDIGGKGLFTKEIEDALLSGDVDIAVHSMKDMPTVLPSGLLISCLLEREDPRDAFLSPHASSVDALKHGATVGTASLRRGAQLKAHRPDLNIVPLRGNVLTRLQKLSDGVCDATLLAVAGLNRLGMEDHITERLSTDVCLPAVAQGAIGVECREDDAFIRDWLLPIHHGETSLRITAERSLLATLDGSCRTPIGGLAVSVEDHVMKLEGLVATPDGSECHRRSILFTASEKDAREAGIKLGETLLSLMDKRFYTAG